MQTTHEETLGIPPSVMTAEFFDTDGKRYNFDQITIDAGCFVEFTTGDGGKIMIRFWQNRQTEKNFPVDKDASMRYEQTILPKNQTGIIGE
jgi:hypothetical protein